VSAFPSATEEKKIKLTLGQKNPRLAQGSYKRPQAAARRGAASYPDRAAARVSNIGLTYTSLPNANVFAPSWLCMAAFLRASLALSRNSSAF
jgi:hypothetical protein